MDEQKSVLEMLRGNPCSFCNDEWGNHGLVHNHDCPGEDIEKRIALLEKTCEEAEKMRCPICKRIGCMSDHGYGGPGDD